MEPRAAVPSPSGGPIRLDSLTGLRALAALVVFGHHAFYEEATRVFGQGRLGVSFFFILSGFVLMWSRRESTSHTQFWWNRFARVYPAYLVCWVAGAVIAVLGTTTDFSLRTFAAGALLLQAWVPERSWYFAINGVAWSLSAEAFFYLSFPLWAGWLARRTDRGVAWLAAACVASVVAVAAFVQLLDDTQEYFGTPDTVLVWLIRQAPPVRILEFVLGACLAVLVLRGRRVPLRLPTALALAAVAYAMCGVVPSHFAVAAVTLVPFSLVIVAAACADLDGRPTVFARRSVVWLGVISYAFYLTHFTVLELVPWAGDRWITRLVVLLPLSVAVAALVHYSVERPAERWLRGRNGVAVGGVRGWRAALAERGS